MSQAVAAAVRSGDRMRAERLLGEIMKSKLSVDTMPFNSVPWHPWPCGVGSVGMPL